MKILLIRPTPSRNILNLYPNYRITRSALKIYPLEPLLFSGPYLFHSFPKILFLISKRGAAFKNSRGWSGKTNGWESSTPRNSPMGVRSKDKWQIASLTPSFFFSPSFGGLFLWFHNFPNYLTGYLHLFRELSLHSKIHSSRIYANVYLWFDDAHEDHHLLG